MQKIWLLAFTLLIFLLNYSVSYAKENSRVEKLTASPSSEVKEIRDYELPYPGLLPDSPLYFLRIIRDKAVSFLISEPLKKAEFNLLQADKRLNAGIYLFNSNREDEKKINLVISTISKAENYFHDAVQKTKQAQKEGREIDEIAQKLKDSVSKHHQELVILAEKSPKKFKSEFANIAKRVSGFEKEVMLLLPKD